MIIQPMHIDRIDNDPSFVSRIPVILFIADFSDTTPVVSRKNVFKSERFRKASVARTLSESSEVMGLLIRAYESTGNQVSSEVDLSTGSRRMISAVVETKLYSMDPPQVVGLAKAT